MSADPFVVQVARLRRSRGTTWQAVLSGSMARPGEDLPSREADSRLIDGFVECDVLLESFEGGVMATGTLRAPWTGVCRRCTLSVGGELSIAVKERFTDNVGDDNLADGPEDEDAYPIVDDVLDLQPMIRDAVLPELPLAPLCDESCKGLCAQCGMDLNEAECGCVPPMDPRWANLDVLRSSS